MGSYLGLRPRNREEAETAIQEIERREIIGINPGIRSLLGAVLTLGLRTAGCCEGHLEGDSFIHPYPWVSFHSHHCGNNFGILYRVLDSYNRDHQIRWIFRDSELELRPMHEALDKGMLKDLQRSANSLADYIFENPSGF